MTLALRLNAVAIFVTVFALLSAGRRDKIERPHKIVRLSEWENCRNKPVTPYHITQRKISTPAKNVYALNAEGVNERATKALESMLFFLTKCTDRTKTNCEHAYRMKWESSATLCPLFSSNMAPWWPLVKAHHPQLQCEYPKGNFTITNMTLEFGTATAMIPSKGSDYWLGRTEIYDENMSPWACVDFELDFPTVRG